MWEADSSDLKGLFLLEGSTELENHSLACLSLGKRKMTLGPHRISVSTHRTIIFMTA